MGTHQLAPGTVLGRYELLLPIAQGGMATVWAARQKGSRGFSKTVAVKTMLPNLSEDATFEQMFLDEAAIASKIHHPNVAEIFDLGEQDEILYLVMEWIDGDSLSALSKQTKKLETEIPLRVAMKIVSQACAGLHAAHELRDDQDQLLQLVHRDVSPQNILVSTAGHVKLVDFGVAKALGRSGATSVGQLKGKVPYMSPEQTRGHDVDRRTDVFAMGSVLYRITTGHHPFIEDNDIKTMRAIASRPPIKPRVRNPSLPVELEQIILRALEKNADKRYQTAAELEADLEKLLLSMGTPVAQEEVGAFVRTTLGERDHKRRAALRDAVRAADELQAQRRASAPSSPPSRSSVATVSDLMLTKTATPPSFATGAALVDEGNPDSSDESTRLMPPGEVHGLADASGEANEVTQAANLITSEQPGTQASRSGVTRAEQRAPLPSTGSMSEPPIASSPTLAAVTDGTADRATPKRRVGAIVAVVAVALALVVSIPLLTSKRAPARAPATPSTSEPQATKPAPGEASTVVVAPSEPASDARPGTTFAVGDLPDNDHPGAASPSSSARGPLPRGALPAATPSVSASPSRPAETPKTPDTAKPAAPPTPTSKPWVPAVQDPGF